MDPNETLRELRDLAETMASGGWFTNANAVDLAEKFEALDAWLTRGGLLPDAWRHNEWTDAYGMSEE